MPKIAVDAMGGDHAPQAIIEGALLAAADLAVEIVLVGQRDAIDRELARHPNAPKVEIANASQTVTMHESPSAALRTGPRSSWNFRGLDGGGSRLARMGISGIAGPGRREREPGRAPTQDNT